MKHQKRGVRKRSAVSDQDGCKAFISVNFSIDLISFFLSVVVCYCFLLIFVLRLENSVIMPETKTSLKKKNEELKAQIDVLTDELKKPDSAYGSHQYWQSNSG